MELTRSRIEEKAREYEQEEPLYAVESEHVEMLPGTFRGDDYGWRDLEWVVQWYFRRYLGAYPDEQRRQTEEKFHDNSFEDVSEALAVATSQAETAEKLRGLTGLAGVDVPVGSAFLQFLYPERYVVVDERVWGVLCEAEKLEGAYPDPPTIGEYLTFDKVCQALMDRFDVDAWTLYRALWRL
ncbi:MAG: hypothetical protein V5A39_01360 [Haloarculaceae archaeon]